MRERASGCAVAGRAVAIALAIGLLFSGSFSAVRAQSEASSTECSQESQAIKAWLPAGARIELLVAAGNTIPEDRWPRYKEEASAILACAGDGAVIEMLPITDSGSSVSPLLIATAPTPSPDLNNPLRARLQREQFVKTSMAAVDALHATKKRFSGFDPLGTLQVAGDSLHHSAGGGKFVVVMIGNGWQQTDRVNLFRWGDNPAKHADDVIRRLKADGTLPNLAGTNVIITGLTRGDARLKMGPAEFVGLKTFWRKLVTASHGNVVWNEAFLPGMTAPI